MFLQSSVWIAPGHEHKLVNLLEVNPLDYPTIGSSRWSHLPLGFTA